MQWGAADTVSAHLTNERKMQKQGLLKEIRRYIGPKVDKDTCACPLVESQ